MPDVGKGSDHATNVAEGWQLPSPFAGRSLGLPLEIDEQKEAVGPSLQDLRQMQVRVDDALHAAHVALEMSKALLDRRTKSEELCSGHAGGFRHYRFGGPGEVTQSPKSGSDVSGSRFPLSRNLYDFRTMSPEAVVIRRTTFEVSPPGMRDAPRKAPISWPWKLRESPDSVGIFAPRRNASTAKRAKLSRRSASIT